MSAALDLVDSMLGWLETFSGSPWFYLVIFSLALLDSVVPIVPSETTVILGGIAAGQGRLSIPIVIAVAAVGAYVGNHDGLRVGAALGRPHRRLVLPRRPGGGPFGPGGGADTPPRWSAADHGPVHPGGRTALTFSCGVTKQPFWAWFTRWDILATALWATYAGTLGYVFGDRFKDSHSTAFWWAFGTALSVTVVIEVVRYVRGRFGSARTPAAALVVGTVLDPGSAPGDGSGSEQGADRPKVGERGAEEG